MTCDLLQSPAVRLRMQNRPRMLRLIKMCGACVTIKVFTCFLLGRMMERSLTAIHVQLLMNPEASNKQNKANYALCGEKRIYKHIFMVN